MTSIFLCSAYIHTVADTSVNKDDISEALHIQEGRNSMEPDANKPKYRDFICGEEALSISPAEPYCLCRPIRRGHLNISLHYPMQQVFFSNEWNDNQRRSTVSLTDLVANRWGKRNMDKFHKIAHVKWTIMSYFNV